MDYKAKCAVGKRGIGYKRKEGDLITPKGRYKIKYICTGKIGLKSFKLKLKKLWLKKMWGGVTIQIQEYNKLISLPSSYTYEKLYKKENIYDIILVLNYNMNPVIKNKGSAIFIHVAKKTTKKLKVYCA